MADESDESSKPWWPGEAAPETWGTLGTKLGLWKQGDVVVDVPVTWVMPLGTDPITDWVNADPYECAFASKSGPKVHMVICSQTCDIGVGDKEPGRQHAFVLVAPLVPGSLIEDGNRKKAREYRMAYLVPASPDPNSDAIVSDPAGWFVDLRLIVPVSKGLLLERTPIGGFVGEDSSSDERDPMTHSDELLGGFAEALAQKFRRPALASVLSEDLPRVIDDHITKFVEASAFRQTEQVRLHVERGTHLVPTAVRVIVLGFSPFNEDQMRMWRGWEKKGRPLLQQSKILLRDTVFSVPSKFSIEEGWNTTPMVLKGIKSSAGW